MPQLGNVVAYAALHAQLEQAVQDCGVTVLSGPPARVDGQDGEGLTVRQGDAALHCRLAVQCDGAGAATCGATMPSTRY